MERYAAAMVNGISSRCYVCILAFMLLAGAPASGAPVASGEDVHLQSLTLTGGAGLKMTNSGSGATATVEFAIGQAGPLGISESPSSGLRAEFGLLPARDGVLAVPEPARSVLTLVALFVLGAMKKSRVRQPIGRDGSFHSHFRVAWAGERSPAQEQR